MPGNPAFPSPSHSPRLLGDCLRHSPPSRTSTAPFHEEQVCARSEPLPSLLHQLSLSDGVFSLVGTHTAIFVIYPLNPSLASSSELQNHFLRVLRAVLRGLVGISTCPVQRPLHAHLRPAAGVLPGSICTSTFCLYSPPGALVTLLSWAHRLPCSSLSPSSADIAGLLPPLLDSNAVFSVRLSPAASGAASMPGPVGSLGLEPLF